MSRLLDANLPVSAQPTHSEFQPTPLALEGAVRTLKVEHKPNELILRYQWSLNPALPFTAALIALASAVAVFWVSSTLQPVFAMIGLAAAYTAPALRFNRTAALVGCGILSIRHRPFPWFSRFLYACEIERLECNQHPIFRENIRIQAVLKKGRRVTLMSWLRSPDEGCWICKLISQNMDVSHSINKD
ncbi:hypothetical protein [Acanthopleuribacter pedis]|uniref:Uncharacterized protein n=1 Tax=Acanthopleuribacter pedis TaxID=442870 RepID=A0A8J7U3Q9_9BACT|nr:hypothetical protein [Acanthopleuribacter pedis]MBO1320688.1 hypothetical protein [Acanthopleuribacter pedis]